jgi:hypothetical protein
VSTLLAFLVNLRTAVVEGIHLTDPRTAKWRFMFLKVFLSVQKESIPLHIFYTSGLNHVTKDELRGVRIAKTSFRLFARMVK